ncbi:alpha/beta hydrolase family esterase [Demequina silvatica]|uniref:alpha/beta hydrolase family esterase n=1 Tax=Demequina silvatica TaxID=1638988 RepID=UPI000781773F|nr:PHB depolymerase family esterase [Demequina silvatica]
MSGSTSGRPRRWIGTVAAVLVAVAACGGGGDDAPAGGATTSGGAQANRPYEVHVPESAGEAPPLLLLLHGYGMTGEQLVDIYDIAALSEERGFLYVAPDGTPDEAGRRFWDASDACCNFTGTAVDDSRYLADLIAAVLKEYGADPDRVAVLGVSNGGFMAYRLACEHADLLAAIASIAGSSAPPSGCDASTPVSVLEVHGTADDTIAYDGAAIGAATYPSAPDSVTAWAERDGCEPTLDPTGAMLDLEATLDGAETTVAAAPRCPAGVDAELWTVTGADHTMDFGPDAVPAIVDFLLAHPRVAP